MNRFNKVLQAEVNKYVAFLTDVLREYHSGWALTDYTAEANRMFLIKHGKAFKHEAVYNILKKLPKYEIDIGVVNAQVSCALLMFDDHRVNEDEENVEPGSEEVSAIGTAVDSTSAPSIGMCTPRPTMGKKKARNFEFNRNKQNASATSAKKAKVEVKDLTRDMLVSRQVSLNKLVEDAERKNDLIEKKMLFRMFMMDPKSDASMSYFATMRDQYLLVMP